MYPSPFVVLSPKGGQELRLPRLGAGTNRFHEGVEAEYPPDPGDVALDRKSVV